MNAQPLDPVVDRWSSTGGPEETGKRRRWPRRLAIGTVLLLVVALGTTGFGAQQTLAFAEAHDGLFLPGISVGDVDVSGMTADEALAAIKETVEPQLDREITVRWGDHAWTTTPRELGSVSNAEDAVAAAVAANDSATWQDLWRMRWQDGAFDFHHGVSVTHDRDQARAFVDAIAAEINLEPVDAVLDHSSGWVEIHPSAVGYQLDRPPSSASLIRAVEGDATDVELSVRTLPPAVTEDHFSQVLLLRQSEFRLYLYQDGEITQDWAVAVGESGYPTPTGEYEVTLKRFMPTWVNPAPNGWGASMPERIGPGPSNPLGVRALNWSPEAGAIRFHGTAATHSIGTAASKGCVRLTNSNVVQLYDLVDVGAKIISKR
jgi:hypothetical protein